MTIQQICDRLAEEAGWLFDMDTDCWWCDVEKLPPNDHPFPPDSIDAAVRAIPEGMGYMLNRFCTGKHHATLFSYEANVGRFESDYHDEASHAVYFACAKARGWM